MASPRIRLLAALAACLALRGAAQSPAPQARQAPARPPIFSIPFGFFSHSDPTADLSPQVRADDVQRRAGDLAAAVAAYTQAIADHPNDVAAYRHRAQAEETQKRLPEALADYSQVIQRQPEQADNYVQRAQCEWDGLRDDPAATADIDRAIARASPGPGHFTLADMYQLRAEIDLGRHQGDKAGQSTPAQFAAAIADLTRANDLLTNPRATQALTMRAAVEASAGDFAAAIADYDRLIARTPDESKLGLSIEYRKRGDVKDAASDPRGAIADYTLAMGTGEQIATAAGKRSAARREIGDEAGAAADAALQRGDAPAAAPREPPAGGSALERSARSQIEGGNFAAAIGDLSRAISEDPEDAALYAERAHAEELGGKARDAVIDYTLALRLAPGDIDTLIARANLRFRRNDRAGALGDLDAATEARPADAGLWAVRARWEHMNGMPGPAAADYDRALALPPTPEMDLSGMRRDRDTAARELAQRQAALKAQTAPPAAFHIRLGGPALLGLPIWIYADGLPTNLAVRYPYDIDGPRITGMNQIELRRNGVLLPPLPAVAGPASGFGRWTAELPTSPHGRLPLHALYDLTPGDYTARWSVFDDDSEPEMPSPHTLLAQSDWLSFQVNPAGKTRQTRWLGKFLASAPADNGLIVGDFLPGLLADTTDPRAQLALGAALYSTDSMVTAYALACQDYLSIQARVALALRLLRERGPNVGLGPFTPLFYNDHREEIVREALSYLHSQNPSQVAVALSILRGARDFRWPADDPTPAAVDRAVSAATPAIMNQGEATGPTLVAYLSSEPDGAGNAQLWRIADQQPIMAWQAWGAIMAQRDPRDLPRFEVLLDAPGAKRVSVLAGLAHILTQSYGEAATPLLHRLLAVSPDRPDKDRVAATLLRGGDPQAIAFFLDAATNDTPDWPELEQDLLADFRGQLPPGVTAPQPPNAPALLAAVPVGGPSFMPLVEPAEMNDLGWIAFLKRQAAHPGALSTWQPPTDSAEAAVLRLRSGDAIQRRAAAAALLQLGNREGNLYADLVNGIIRDTGAGGVAVESPAWRDAVLLLGQMQFPYAAGPLINLIQHPVAASALALLNAPAVPAINDVLLAGSRDVRPIAAQVLGQIGGPEARAALRAALQTEKDATTRAAIQTALRHLGQKPPPMAIE